MFDYESYCDTCELQELGESSDIYLAINKIMEKEIDQRVAKEVADVGEVRNKNMELQQIINRLKDENLSLKREKSNTEYRCENEKADIKKQCQQQVAEAQADALKTLFGDYKEGDTVYWVDDARLQVECKKCAGKGKFDVEVDGEKMYAICPTCRGDGHKILENGKRVESKRCRGIYASINIRGEICAVADLSEWTKRPLSTLMSEEKAEAKVNAHNDKIKARYMGAD